MVRLRVPRVEWLRELRSHTSCTASHDLAGFKLTERVHMHTHVGFESGALTMLALDWELEGLDRPFRIAGTDIEVPAGTYSGWTFWSSQNTNRAAPVSFSNRIDLPQGQFNTTLTRVQLRYAFNPSLAAQSSGQYGDQAGVWTGHLRFGWLDTAGTGLFVVHNERQLVEVSGISGVLPREGLGAPERTFAVK